MLTMKDLILNSQCITKDNFDFIKNGELYLPLLNKYNKIYITDKIYFGNNNIIKEDSIITNKEWLLDKLYYSFEFIITEEAKNIELLELILSATNPDNKEMTIKFNLVKLKNDLITKKITKKDDVINIFMDSLLIKDGNNFVSYYGDYALNLINLNNSSINVFSSLILSSKAPLLTHIVYLDKVLAEGFKVFLTEFFGMFLEAPYKN